MATFQERIPRGERMKTDYNVKCIGLTNDTRSCTKKNVFKISL